jgi:hypothetical protein
MPSKIRSRFLKSQKADGRKISESWEGLTQLFPEVLVIGDRRHCIGEGDQTILGL